MTRDEILDAVAKRLQFTIDGYITRGWEIKTEKDVLWVLKNNIAPTWQGGTLSNVGMYRCSPKGVEVSDTHTRMEYQFKWPEVAREMFSPVKQLSLFQEVN